MQRNVGGLDRIVRAVAGIWLVAVAFAAYRGGKPQVGVAAAIAGAGLLYNAATRFCGGNYLLGIDTTRDFCSADGR